MSFPTHTLDSAPAGARSTLAEVEKAYGMIPNLHRVLAESPGALKGYFGLSKALQETGLTPAEQQVVLIAVSVENGCSYCVAAHSTVAKGGGLFDEPTLGALRSGNPLPDAKLEALRSFTLAVVRERAWVGSEVVDAFLSAGFERTHLLGVLTGIALKTLSNYTNHIVDTPLDDAFAGARWKKV